MARRLLFDIDNTLFPTAEFAERARRNAVRAMVAAGLDLSEARLYRLLMKQVSKKGSNYERHFDDLCKSLRIRKPAKYVAAAVAAYHDTKNAIQPYPEVPRTLLKLKELGHPLYIATSGTAVKQWDKLIRMGLTPYFEDVFVTEELGAEKGAGFFRKVLKKLRTEPSNCVMIGDRIDIDIAPAMKAGIKAVRVLRGPYEKKKGHADAEVKALSSLPSALKRI